MTKRKIISIDEERCNGCGLCIPNCPEGALQMIDGKARLISDLFCDGLGACIGECPQGAIAIAEREAQPYDEKKVMANIAAQGPNVIAAHLEHLKGHGEKEYLKQAVEYLRQNGIEVPSREPHAGHGHGGGCPGSAVKDFRDKKAPAAARPSNRRQSQLGQWPVQIRLVPPRAPFLQDADLLIAADCVPFAYADFHDDLLAGTVLLVGCPKLDDIEYYREKISEIIKTNDLRSVTYAHMEVPCCSGLTGVIQDAIAASGRKIPFKEAVISIKGERIR